MSEFGLEAETMARWLRHPAAMVRDLFGVSPDPWQEEVLEAFPTSRRIAMRASKGVGKSTLLAWMAWNFLLTRPHPKIAATSISADNLSDGLWTEMQNWQKDSPLLLRLFEWTKTRISHRYFPATWWMSARTWPKTADTNQQSSTLAGLHADYILFLLDETGAMPDAVMASAEAALATGIEAKIVQAGNPTHREGPLYRACTSERNMWHVVEISGDPDDPRRAPRVDITWAREQIAKYGRSNPWVLVNVFGQFPPSSLNSLIGVDEVMEATKRQYRVEDFNFAARVLGIDVAREGDDCSVIFPRQGLMAFDPLQYRNIDGTQGAGLAARKWEDWDADACFVDNTGGFGASWIDNLERLGRQPIGIGFANRPDDMRYANKRAEMAFTCVEWVKKGGSIPNIAELVGAMSQTTYSFQGDRFLIEPKPILKQRLGYSPDHFDSLMLTFAQPVVRKQPGIPGRRPVGFESDYQPLAPAWNIGGREHRPNDGLMPGSSNWRMR